MISQRKPNNIDESSTYHLSASLITNGSSDDLSNLEVNKFIATDLEAQDSNDSLDGYENPCDTKTQNNGFKLVFGVCGIYVTYLYYGTLQEDVYTYPNFHYVWFVQVLETLSNVVTSFIGRRLSQDKSDNQIRTSDPYDKIRKNRMSQLLFILCGASLICSKALTSKSLNSGLSYPIATLAKSSRMAPVMLGQLLLGNSKYSMRDYIQVMCIILGTAILGLSSMSEESTLNSKSTSLGINLIIMSLLMDGISGGLQKRIKEEGKAAGVHVKGFEFMFYTNLYMSFISIVVATANSDFVNGMNLAMEYPDLLRLIFRFCFFGAAGQSFIFFTIANFDPLVCSTVTTTRKVFSVLLSIWYKGHVLNHQGWSGILLACIGILSELQHKFQLSRANDKKAVK